MKTGDVSGLTARLRRHLRVDGLTLSRPRDGQQAAPGRTATSRRWLAELCAAFIARLTLRALASERSPAKSA
jgi:hypothetical protein